MPRINRKILAQIKEQISIVDIAGEFGFTVIPKSRGTFSLREHDSVLIYPKTNSFYRYSNGIGGDVLKFMEAFPDEPAFAEFTFMKAYALLSKRVNKDVAAAPLKKNKIKIQDKYKTFQNDLATKQIRAKNLNKQFHFDSNCKNAMAYLIQTRKIDSDIVKKLIHENCIKQDTSVIFKNRETGEFSKKITDDSAYDRIETKCVVFIGHDEFGMTASACSRACNASSDFKMEYEGTDYSYGWLHDPEVISCNAYLQDQNYDPDKQLLCFESYIDMMSFMTLLKMQGSDYTKYAYLSCGSATKYHTVSAAQERLGYNDITICFDNDTAGQQFTESLKKELEEKGVHVNVCVSKEKDWNAELLRKVTMKDKGIKKQISVATSRKSADVRSTETIKSKELCR